MVAALVESSMGHNVREGRTIDVIGLDVLGVPGRIVFVDGARVWTIEYPNTSAYDEARSLVGKDGHEIGDVSIDWVPHFYGSGRLIVLYLGDRPSTRAALEELFGRQFAGV